MNDQIDCLEFIDEFVEMAEELTAARGSFTISEVVQGLDSETGKMIWDWTQEAAPDDLEELIEMAELVPLLGEPERYFSRNVFFQGAEFLVKLTPFEFSNSIWVVGHRILPFFGEDCLPEVSFIGPHGKTLRRKKISAPFRDIIVCHTLFSSHEWLSEEGLEPEEVTDGTSAIPFSGLDLAPLIKAGLRADDLIKVKITNHDEARCRLEIYPREAMTSDPGRLTRWKDAFEQGLDKAIECQAQCGRLFNNVNLVGAAFYHGGRELLHEPAMPWVTAIRSGDMFDLQPGMHGELLVWRKDKDVKEYLSNVLRDQFVDNLPEFDDPEELDFEQLMSLMGYDLDSEIVTAFMLDAHHLSGSLASVRERCFDERIELEFPELASRFDQLLEQLWSEAADMPKKVRDLRSVKVRHDLLELKDREIQLIRRAEQTPGFDPRNLLDEDFSRFREVSFLVDQMLVCLNTESLRNNRKYTEMDQTVKQAQELYDYLLPLLESHLR